MMPEPTQEQIEAAARAMMFPTIGKPSGYWLNKATAALIAAAGVGDEQLRARIAELDAALQTLIDANEGNLSDVDGALYEARRVLTPEKKD